jgi:hypothetical protein
MFLVLNNLWRLPMYLLTVFLVFLVFRQAMRHPATSCIIAFGLGGGVAVAEKNINKSMTLGNDKLNYAENKV